MENSCKYYITRRSEDGSEKVVQRIRGNKEEALQIFYAVINEQAIEYHIKKTMKTWQVLRLYDANSTLIAQES